jgi:predicted AlkP superfamily pyrophosphatase or phosphodiesterase
VLLEAVRHGTAPAAILERVDRCLNDHERNGPAVHLVGHDRCHRRRRTFLDCWNRGDGSQSWLTERSPLTGNHRLAWAAVLLPALLTAACAAAPGQAERPDRAVVLLVSFDGFRWDYQDRFDTPHLDRLAAGGVRAGRLVPVFPTKTFPMHYSLVTGLHPDRHGIIANNIEDPAIGHRFRLSNREAVQDSRWWGGEPIWVTAERQGQRAATLFWPGSEAAIQGVRPSEWLPYDHDMPNEDRVALILSWLDRPPGERPTLLTLYFSDTDTAGHRHGPDSLEVRQAAEALDGQLGLLLQGLRQRGLADAVNIIVVSDHGMAPTSPDRLIVLDDLVDLNGVRVQDWSPVLAVRARDGDHEGLYRQLAGAHPKLAVYRKEELPRHWHYGTHSRVTPVVAVAAEGWTIASRAALSRIQARGVGGDHGYDNALPSMHGLFVAAGPAFRRGLRVPEVGGIHLYELMTAILGLEPAPNQGDLDAIRTLLWPEIVSRTDLVGQERAAGTEGVRQGRF